ncbi:MAG TPA: 3-hydroxyacyl-ACP dehydratase FabZ [Verrucomicrobiae bacterium]|nr:3-hydroxyacyl-ACP dehydratase FabZ [Verrucomicrobiae bacterium]
MNRPLDLKATYSLEEILRFLPHRSPFLFVDRVTHLIPYKSIVAERLLRADEPHFQGHFPGQPIMPGVLTAEALAQTGGLLLGLSDAVMGQGEAVSRIFFLVATNLKFTHPARPGDMLIMKATTDTRFSGLFRFHAEAFVGRNMIASGALTLATRDLPS